MSSKKAPPQKVEAMPNVWGIDEIIIDKLLPTIFFCSLGKDSYLVHAHIEFTPCKVIPNYDDIIAEWKNWFGKTVPVEEVCRMLFNQFMAYAPLKLEVRATNQQGVCPTVIKRFPSDRHFELTDPKSSIGANIIQPGC